MGEAHEHSALPEMRLAHEVGHGVDDARRHSRLTQPPHRHVGGNRGHERGNLGAHAFAIVPSRPLEGGGKIAP